MNVPRDRPAARLVLIDDDNRILLLHGIDMAKPSEPFWFTVGGGLDTGETAPLAAAREAAEEVGLVLDPESLGEPAWSGTAEFTLDGVAIRNVQDFFVAKVPMFEPDMSGMDSNERASIIGYRWWSLADLLAYQAAGGGDRPIYPPDLGEQIKEYLKCN